VCVCVCVCVLVCVCVSEYVSVKRGVCNSQYSMECFLHDNKKPWFVAISHLSFSACKSQLCHQILEDQNKQQNCYFLSGLLNSYMNNEECCQTV